MCDIQSSQLALSKSNDPKGKTIAREMITDHRKTTSKLPALPKTSSTVPSRR